MYHVAPLVYYRDKYNNYTPYVFDPSINSTGPIKLDDWRKKISFSGLTKSNYRVVPGKKYAYKSSSVQKQYLNDLNNYTIDSNNLTNTHSKLEETKYLKDCEANFHGNYIHLKSSKGKLENFKLDVYSKNSSYRTKDILSNYFNGIKNRRNKDFNLYTGSATFISESNVKESVVLIGQVVDSKGEVLLIISVKRENGEWKKHKLIHLVRLSKNKYTLYESKDFRSGQIYHELKK